MGGAESSTETYDSSSGTWTLTAPMGANRYIHSAGLLPALARQRPLRVVSQDGDDERVDEPSAPFNQVQVAIGNRIEGAGINGDMPIGLSRHRNP